MAELYLQVWVNSHEDKQGSLEEVGSFMWLLSETALEYANRCEGTDDYTQLNAKLVRA